MKKTLLLIIILSITTKISAQKVLETTNEFTIEGLVEKTITINLDSLKNYATIKIDSIIITNHLGSRKSILKNIGVIPIKTFLNRIAIQVESPKQLSECYFVFTASDNYKVVFSWNEIFNNDLGREIYIITEVDGKKIENLSDSISVISRTDLNTGRRYVKSLKKIVVKRAE